MRFGQQLTEMALNGHRFMVKEQSAEALGRFLTCKNSGEFSGCLTNQNVRSLMFSCEHTF